MSGRKDARDFADLLEAVARRIREDPAFAHDVMHPVKPGVELMRPAAAGLDVRVDEGPDFTAVDVFVDDRNVTVTAETRDASAADVHVSVMDRMLILSVGDGAQERRRDVPLPQAVDEDAAVATFRNGVLDVVLPLRRAKRPEPAA